MDNDSDLVELKKTDFGNGSMTRIILRQAIPLIVAQFTLLLYNTVDRIFIGHIEGIGKVALTGLGITFPIVTFISAVTLLFGLGGTPLFSIARGEEKIEEARSVMGNSFVLLGISSIVLMAISYVFMSPILYSFGASDITYVYASSYLYIYLLGTPFLMIGNGMNYYITAQGFPKTAMITTLGGAILNLLFDPLFIFVFDLGIKGAAIATVLSQLISFIWVMSFIVSKKAIIKLTRSALKIKGEIVKGILALGIPNFIMNGTNALVQVLCNKSLNYYGGDDYVTIMTVIQSVRALLNVVINAVTSGSQPVLGFNYGAKKYNRVAQGIKINIALGLIYTAVAWVFIIIFPDIFIKMFISKEDATPELINMGVHYMRIYFMAFIFMSFQLAGQSTFMALGKAKPAIFFSLLRKVFIIVPFTLILPLVLADQPSGVFWAEPISNVIGGLASFLTMYFFVFRRLNSEEGIRKLLASKTGL